MLHLEYTLEIIYIFGSIVQMIDFLKNTFHRLIKDLNCNTYRYLYDSVNLDNRLLGIIGARGVGKTTLMLQYIKNNLYAKGEVIYFSADNIFFSTVSLLEFVSDLHLTEGIKIFFIDEVHKYNNWEQELKNIYDSFPGIKIIFSGSSSIDLIKGSYDLSRRATLLKLHGMSLREYINFATGASLQAISLDDLINHYSEYDAVFSQIPKIKGLFKKYLEVGYYPFLFENENSYQAKILSTIDKTIYEDITNFYDLKTANLSHFKRILNFLASSSPGTFSVNNLAENLSIDNKTATHYLHILTETGLVRVIPAYAKGSQILRKSGKVFLQNTSLLHALTLNLGPESLLGKLREMFFVQHVDDSGGNIFCSNLGDFQVGNTIFEVGGKNKKWAQIKSREIHGILVLDDILTSAKNVIPLYYFGFLY